MGFDGGGTAQSQYCYTWYGVWNFTCHLYSSTHAVVTHPVVHHVAHHLSTLALVVAHAH